MILLFIFYLKYEQYATKGRDINFDVKYDLHQSTSFRYTNSSGGTGDANIFIEQWSGKINFSFINNTLNTRTIYNYALHPLVGVLAAYKK